LIVFGANVVRLARFEWLANEILRAKVKNGKETRLSRAMYYGLRRTYVGSVDKIFPGCRKLACTLSDKKRRDASGFPAQWVEVPDGEDMYFAEKKPNTADLGTRLRAFLRAYSMSAATENDYPVATKELGEWLGISERAVRNTSAEMRHVFKGNHPQAWYLLVLRHLSARDAHDAKRIGRRLGRKLDMQKMPARTGWDDPPPGRWRVLKRIANTYPAKEGRVALRSDWNPEVKLEWYEQTVKRLPGRIHWTVQTLGISGEDKATRVRLRWREWRDIELEEALEKAGFDPIRSGRIVQRRGGKGTSDNV
jgi:hypothetical protein